MNGNITSDTVSQMSLCDVFDVPELSNMNDIIVDGLYDSKGGKALSLSPFTVQGVDYSLVRLVYYPAT